MQTPPLKDRPILSFALERWDDVPRGRHHVMYHLARHNSVLFTSPPFSIRDLMSKEGRESVLPAGVATVANRLYTYSHPWWLPTNYRFPTVDRVVTRLRRRQLRNAMNSIGMTRPILYIWMPLFVDEVGKFNESLVVYHCYDEYRSFNMSSEQRERLIEQESRLLQRADVVFAASEELCARRRLLNPNTHVVRNAVDFDLFASAQHADTLVPDELASIPRPIIGCVATQTLVMDLHLIAHVFGRRPDWSFVFIGMDKVSSSQASEAVRSVQGLSNVHFIGRRPWADIPRYLKGCDVCVIPWQLNDITLVSSSPLKLYEYFAAGRPVISTPLPLLSHLGSIMSFAETSDEWIAAIEKEIRQDNPKRIEERQARARENTWEQRVAFISQMLAEALDKRSGPPCDSH